MRPGAGERRGPISALRNTSTAGRFLAVYTHVEPLDPVTPYTVLSIELALQ